MLENLAYVMNKLESIALDDAELYECRHSYLTVVDASLCKQVWADALLVDLLNDQVLDIAWF